MASILQWFFSLDKETNWMTFNLHKIKTILPNCILQRYLGLIVFFWWKSVKRLYIGKRIWYSAFLHESYGASAKVENFYAWNDAVVV